MSQKINPIDSTIIEALPSRFDAQKKQFFRKKPKKTTFKVYAADREEFTRLDDKKITKKQFFDSLLRNKFNGRETSFIFVSNTPAGIFIDFMKPVSFYRSNKSQLERPLDILVKRYSKEGEVVSATGFQLNEDTLELYPEYSIQEELELVDDDIILSAQYDNRQNTHLENIKKYFAPAKEKFEDYKKNLPKLNKKIVRMLKSQPAIDFNDYLGGKLIPNFENDDNLVAIQLPIELLSLFNFESGYINRRGEKERIKGIVTGMVYIDPKDYGDKTGAPGYRSAIIINVTEFLLEYPKPLEKLSELAEILGKEILPMLVNPIIGGLEIFFRAGDPKIVKKIEETIESAEADEKAGIDEWWPQTLRYYGVMIGYTSWEKLTDNNMDVYDTGVSRLGPIELVRWVLRSGGGVKYAHIYNMSLYECNPEYLNDSSKVAPFNRLSEPHETVSLNLIESYHKEGRPVFLFRNGVHPTLVFYTRQQREDIVKKCMIFAKYGKSKSEQEDKTIPKDEESLFTDESWTVYKVNPGNDFVRLNDFEEYLQALMTLPARFVFLFKSPIGYYALVTEIRGGAALSKKNQKLIEDSLYSTAGIVEQKIMVLNEPIVVIKTGIISLNKRKGTIKSIFDRNVQFSSKIGLASIQQYAIALNNQMTTYLGPEVIDKIPKAAPKKTTKKTFKNWTAFVADQNIVPFPVVLVFVRRNELKKYSNKYDKVDKLNKVFSKKYYQFPDGYSLIQLVVIASPADQKRGFTKYTYPEMFQYTLINRTDKLVSTQRTYTISSDDLHKIVRKEINRIDEKIP